MSAILKVTEFLKSIRVLNTKLKREKADYFLLPVVLAEDISSAFESICHTTIERILDRVYDSGAEVKMKGLILSYLKRQSQVTDGGGNRIGVKKRYENRTSPQGSILSPAL